MSRTDHELVRCFAEHGYALSAILVDMLNEHQCYQTAGRGCGYTQAVRVLSELINLPRHHHDYQDLRVFQALDPQNLRDVVDQAHLHGLTLNSWRHLDQNPEVLAYIEIYQHDFAHALTAQVVLQRKLRQIQNNLNFEESHVIAALIEDIILPKTSEETGFLQISSLHVQPYVSAGPMAEKFFLKIAHQQILRRGEINIFVDENDRPVFMEKLNMGDNHSCISLQPILMNGVRLPQGSLFSVQYDPEKIRSKRINKTYNGYVIPITEVDGFYFLRLTTLAISSENRCRALNNHVRQQQLNGLYSPETTQLSQILAVAEAQ